MEYLADIIASGDTENYRKVQLLAIELKQAEKDLKNYHQTFCMFREFVETVLPNWREKWAEYYTKNKRKI